MDDKLFEDKKYDNSLFEDKKMDDSLFEDTPHTDSHALPELGRGEAALTSFGQGAGLGLAPVVSGLVGAAGNAVEQAGDALGLTTDSELEKQGFTMPDKKTGLEGLMSAYYDSRQRQKDAQAAAHEQYPVQSIAMNIAGAIPTTIASGGATGALSKVLPSASNLGKGASVLSKVAAGAREGAKAGALVGFGEGDSKLAEGDAAGTVGDVAKSAIGGAAVGGILPAATHYGGKLVKGTADFVGDLPVINQVKTAFKGGLNKMNLTEKASDDAIKKYSETVLDRMRQSFSKLGINKADALDYADEMGVRINAGEATQDVIDDMVQRGAIPDDIAEKTKFMNLLTYLKNGPEDSLQNKADVARAKMIDKMQQKGYDLLDETQSNAHVQDILPESQANSKLATTKQVFQKIGEESADGLDDASDKVIESAPVTKILQQAEKTLGLDLRKYDLNNLTMRELEEIIGHVNAYSGVNNAKGAVTPLERMAGSYAATLRDLSNEALENAGQNAGNGNISAMFNAVRKAGIKGNIQSRGKTQTRDMVDAIKNTIKAGDSTKLQRMGESLNEADPKMFGDFADKTEFLNDFNSLARTVKPLNSGNTNPTSFLGGVRGVALTAANKAGKVVQPVAKSLTTLVDMPGEQLNQLSQRLSQSQNKAAQQFAAPLLKAAQSDERRKSAILYGLYQQPAFRDMYQSLGEDAVDAIMPVGTDKESDN